MRKMCLKKFHGLWYNLEEKPDINAICFFIGIMLIKSREFRFFSEYLLGCFEKR